MLLRACTAGVMGAGDCRACSYAGLGKVPHHVELMQCAALRLSGEDPEGSYETALCTPSHYAAERVSHCLLK